MTGSPDPIVIIGAGIAGLTCARELHSAGLPVIVLEAEPEIGGDLRSTRDEDGFLYDKGFQVVLSAYPAVKRQLNLDALGSRSFEPGAMVWTNQGLTSLSDPLRNPASAWQSLRSPLFPLTDKLRLAKWALSTRRHDWYAAADAANEFPEDRSSLEELQAQGFSEAFIQHFARPFWGGISLDPTLGVSAGVLRFTLKMFLEGQAVLPRDGASAIPAALATELPEDAILTSTWVRAIEEEDGKITGVRLENGSLVSASAVVVATNPRVAAELTGIEAIPTETVGCVTVYLSSTTDPGVGPRLVLDGTGKQAVNHLAPISAVQAGTAPNGQHLVAAVMLGNEAQDSSDERIWGAAKLDTETMLNQPGQWEVRRIVRTPHALFRQPPGIHRRLPDVTTGRSGLFLAGSYTVDASLNGAILSGETAARAVRNYLPPLTT